MESRMNKSVLVISGSPRKNGDGAKIVDDIEEIIYDLSNIAV
jgi:hypothetical protein